jgi:uncharacterized protein YkwD
MMRLALLSSIFLGAACGPQSPPAAPGGAGEATEPEAIEPEAIEPEAEPTTEPTTEPAGDDMAQAFVDAHNRRRARHCADPLAWSDELAAVAQAWADELARQGCAFEHSRTKYGENLAGGTAGVLDAEATVEMWYREVDQYDFAKGGFSMETGHFTQVVWKSTTQVGCGVVTCGGMDIIVCNYAPAGNYERQYKANVLPEGC